MLMQAAAQMLARQMPGTFCAPGFPAMRDSHSKADRKVGKINRKATPDYRACAIAYNSSIKKRMRRARRDAA
jgi:hypothetical protein